MVQTPKCLDELYFIHSYWSKYLCSELKYRKWQCKISNFLIFFSLVLVLFVLIAPLSSFFFSFTSQPLGNGDIVASDEYTAEVERYIGERLREKIGPLLLDSLDARRENDVDTLLELIKAFERRLNMPCVRSSCETLASRLDSLLEYELEDVFLKSKASLFPEECLMTFCRQHCLSHVVRTLDRFEAEQFALSNNTAEVVGGDFANLDSFSPERGTHLGPATASSTVEPRHPPYGGHKSGSHISTMGESYNSSSSYSAPRPLTSVAASAHVPQSPYRAAEFAAESRRQYQEAPPLNPTILRLTGMPLDVDTKLVRLCESVLFLSWQTVVGSSLYLGWINSNTESTLGIVYT